MPNTLQLSFTKVIFQPTPTAWAHTYTAGSFFAVTSLATPIPPLESDINAIGKEISPSLKLNFSYSSKKTYQHQASHSNSNRSYRLKT